MEAVGIGTFGSVGGQQPLPIGSMAKMMTALIVLNDSPLAVGQSGYEYTVTADDVNDLEARVNLDESTVDVTAGEQLSEFQLLEAMLIPSGDNIAGILAKHDAGTLAAFTKKMNAEAHALGMDHTTYTDPSGFLPTTVSTATDQMRLGQVAMRNPVFAQIVGSSSVTLPLVGVVDNVDSLAGSSGFVGIKTGSDSQAKGCFTFASVETVDGKQIMLVGAVLHQGQGSQDIVTAALDSAQTLVQSAVPYITSRTLFAAHQRIATLVGPSGQTSAVEADSTVNTIGWNGLRVPIRISTRQLGTSVKEGQVVAEIAAPLSAPVPAVATSPIQAPGLLWRLKHLA